MTESTSHSFRLTRSQRGAEKLIEGGIIIVSIGKLERLHTGCANRGVL